MFPVLPQPSYSHDVKGRSGGKEERLSCRNVNRHLSNPKVFRKTNVTKYRFKLLVEIIYNYLSFLLRDCLWMRVDLSGRGRCPEELRVQPPVDVPRRTTRRRGPDTTVCVVWDTVGPSRLDSYIPGGLSDGERVVSPLEVIQLVSLWSLEDVTI